jgi:hypothetical protein
VIFSTSAHADISIPARRRRFSCRAIATPLPLRAIARALLVFLGACSPIACRSAPARPSCPESFVADEARGEALLETLASVPEGARLREEVRRKKASFTVCFGRIDVSALTTAGAALLDETLPPKEAAARLGHLLVHAVRGSPLAAPGDGGCDEATTRALAAEADALSIELDLRRALGVTRPYIRYEFEGDFWRTAEDERAALVLAYLRAHPKGAPGIDALAAGYERRCRQGLP